MNIVMIGAGNVAWHLAPALENTGHKVVAVYSRSRRNAQSLTQRLYEAPPLFWCSSTNKPTIFAKMKNGKSISYCYINSGMTGLSISYTSLLLLNATLRDGE